MSKKTSKKTSEKKIKKSNKTSKKSSEKKSETSSVRSGNRKVFELDLESLSQPALQRIMRRSGVKRISKDTYINLRNITSDYMTLILKKVLVFTQHNGRRTVQLSDLHLALRSYGIELAAGINPNSKKTRDLQSCNSRGVSGPSKKKKTEPKDTKSDTSDTSDKKSHRFRPGTRAMQNIRFQQKNSDCLAIPKKIFERLVRAIVYIITDDSELRFSPEVFSLLQLVVETRLIEICQDAYVCTLHAKRDTLQSKDIELVQYIRRNDL